MSVRRYLHGRGLRYGLHRTDLPGRPDIVLTCRGTVVFVHGCFWHGHRCPHGSVASKTNVDYWIAKIKDNQQRDCRQQAALRALGWQVETIWECQTQDSTVLARLARKLLAR